MEMFWGTRTLAQSIWMTTTYSTRIDSDAAFLDPDESAHLIQVLRKRTGDHVLVTNGIGGGWKAVISHPDKRGTVLKLIEPLDGPPSWGPQIHLALAPPKQAARLEWFLEKVTEIGVNRISMLATQRTERTRWRHDRLQRVLVAAMKQSGQFYLPQLHTEDMTIAQMVSTYAGTEWTKLIPTCDWGNLPRLSSVYTSGQSVIIAIGPEGDFSPEEIQTAQAGGFHGVLLSDHRLRTETAGVIACTQIHTLNGL